jgi:uncharacterized protein (DUF1330 family)
MSAYVIVEVTQRDAQARERYSAAAAPTLKTYGGEFIATGSLEMLFGEATFSRGAIIRFPDRDAALNWYHCAEYQALIGERTQGMDCRFSLLGG